jgi:hypothetical protein
MKIEETFERSQDRWQGCWAMVMRRRWWLVGSLFFRSLAAFGAAHIWPEKYCSEALILPEQQFVTRVINSIGR